MLNDEYFVIGTFNSNALLWHIFLLLINAYFFFYLGTLLGKMIENMKSYGGEKPAHKLNLFSGVSFSSVLN